MNLKSQSILVSAAVVSVLCLSLRLTSGDVMIKIKELQGGDGGKCPQMEERERALNEIRETFNSLLTEITVKSAINDTLICGGTPGWRRIAFINMTNTSYSCPTGLNLTSYSKRTCGRSNYNPGCSSTTFDVGGLPYSRVCGRIRGYQFGVTIAFFYFQQNHTGIDSHYVDGVSLTHVSVGSRQHIWTFAAGLTEVSSNFPYTHCPCDALYIGTVPSFVGNDYFCESGLHSAWSQDYGYDTFYPDDPLWDGKNCTDNSTCCEFNNPPWFTKTLKASTIDDIELRICNYYTSQYEDIPLELIDLYVQ